MTIEMTARRPLARPQVTQTSVSAPHPCHQVVTFDEDFDGDGINDIAINGLSMLPTSALEIFLVSIQQGRVDRAGVLPLASTRERSGYYSHLSSAGGSVWKTFHLFKNREIVIPYAFEKVLHGDVCHHPVKVTLGDEACQGKVVSAQPETPICIKHIRAKAPRILPSRTCNFP